MVTAVWTWLACTTAHAAVPPTSAKTPQTAATLGPIDLDGDRVRETVRQTDAGVVVGKSTVPCGDTSFPCELEVHDITGGDGRKELAVCELGPRDDRSCRLFGYRGGKLFAIPLPVDPSRRAQSEIYYEGRVWAHQLETKGNGIVLADQPGRLYTRREKLVWRDGGLVHVPQPLYDMGGKSVHVDRTFPITSTVTGGAVVANVRTGSDVRLLVESGDHPGHVLVVISSGLVGWTTIEALKRASDQVMGAYMTG